MSRQCCRSSVALAPRPRLYSWLTWVWGLLILVGLAHPLAAQPPRNVPGFEYFNIKQGIYSGDFMPAYRGMIQETNGGALKFIAGPWVDSIAYYTMAGEAAFQAGRHKQALDAFSAALRIYLQHPNWLQSARMDIPALMPAAPGAVRAAPWGKPTRNRVVGTFPETYMVALGSLGLANAPQQSGVAISPTLLPVHVSEIAFCTGWALKRRRELLGPLSQHDDMHAQLLTTLSKRPGQPNHWSEAWVSVQLGLAFAAMGKDPQAKTELERGVLAAGRFDHPLTSLALVELARLAAANDDVDGSLALYAEASYAAVQFSEPLVLEEAFRGGFNVFIRAGKRGMFPPLAAALTWCNSNNTGGELSWLITSLQTMTAENAMLLGNTKLANDMLTRARTLVAAGANSGNGMSSSKPGAQYQFVLAMSSYYQAQPAAGDQAVNKLMEFQRDGSLRLFQIAYTDALRTAQIPLQARIAIDVYGALLRDPTNADWLTEPRESLSVLSIPHSVSYENWFEVAIERKEFEKAIEIADRCRRHRFLCQQPLGGRLLNLQWLLESPVETLDRTAAIQRQDLLNRFPEYTQAAEKSRKLRDELQHLPLVAEAAADITAQKKKIDEIVAQSTKQELLLRYMAVRREAADTVFPPFRSTKDIQSSLPPNHGVLAYFNTATKTHVFLITNERFGHAELKNRTGLRKSLESLLQAWALYDGNKTMRLDELADTKWRKPAIELYQQVMADVRTDSKPLEELVIVPDGLLWYVPFEALQVPRGETTVSLLQLSKIRYAPTASLAVGDKRPRRRPGPMGVVLSKLFPREPEEQSQLAFDELARAVPEAVAIRGPLVPQANVYSTLFDRLAVFSEITPSETGMLDWTPVPLASKGPGANLAQWLDLPWGAPDQIYLPGFRTAAESAFRKSVKESATLQPDGQELFMSICGLMATGTRTVLIGRWRPGGRSSYDLVREFAQEVPFSTASAAWQRAVKLVSAAPIDPALEPRVAGDAQTQPIKADHPFFWAAFMLADTGAEPQAAGDADGVIKVKKEEK